MIHQQILIFPMFTSSLSPVLLMNTTSLATTISFPIHDTESSFQITPPAETVSNYFYAPDKSSQCKMQYIFAIYFLFKNTGDKSSTKLTMRLPRTLCRNNEKQCQ